MPQMRLRQSPSNPSSLIQAALTTSTLPKQPSLRFGFATMSLARRLMMRTPWPD
jgi:hypothetical protein